VVNRNDVRGALHRLRQMMPGNEDMRLVCGQVEAFLEETKPVVHVEDGEIVITEPEPNEGAREYWRLRKRAQRARDREDGSCGNSS
jgi:acyl-coenzyme A synthetase/AMP-(fatty) acid ligase